MGYDGCVIGVCYEGGLSPSEESLRSLLLLLNEPPAVLLFFRSLSLPAPCRQSVCEIESVFVR